MNGWQVFVEVPGHPPVEVKPGESIIGRSRTAQVHIPESTVSRQHARLVAGALGEVTVEDLGSANGTYVNGRKTEGRQKLADGDRVMVGDAEVRVRIVAPVAPAEATVRMTLPPMSAPPPGAPAGAPLPVALPPSAYATPSAPLAVPAAGPAWPPPPPPARPPAPLRLELPLHADAAPRREAPPAPPPARPAARTPELPSVTVIDRLPIPEASPEVLRASRLSRAVPAGFWIRVIAALIDSAILVLAAIPILALSSFAFGRAPATAALLQTSLFSLLGLAYPLFFWATRGATPGKSFLKLAIVGKGGGASAGLGWGTAVVRLLGYAASGALLGIGFLLVAFTSQNQGLHDFIAGTRVVRLR